MKKQPLERIDDTLFRSFSPSNEPWIVGGDGTQSVIGTYTLDYYGSPNDCDQGTDADACYPDMGP